MLGSNFRERFDQDAPLVGIENEQALWVHGTPAGPIGLGVFNRISCRGVFRWRCAFYGIGRGCQGDGGSGKRESGKLHFSYFSSRARFTSGVTNGVISPPRLAISFTSREATA